MLKLKKLAITGGLSSGKTTVCHLFKDLGAFVVSADEIVHNLLVPDSIIGQKLVQLFGPSIAENNYLNRKKIAQQAFIDIRLLKVLEALIHPVVYTEIEKEYQHARQAGKYPLFIAEIPLLYELFKQDEFDIVITVTADLSICQKRFIKQTHQTIREFEQRMAQQIDPESKAKKSDYVIKNNGSLAYLKDQVTKLYSLLTTQ
ncbi:Dephospho-CoA kinase [Candidatus Rhabdochlamydia oedothoracis]|uniref:Dephospho-CoA kinase n=1 Tax=Candidatus Rhabdochlamydia oedothoracis TaxID=2720720 RepID=A0ABX8V2I1_9BACT|nr:MULTISPECIES: dephospho-CoA kinase [Rhabdochlamydia]KAG6559176.1 Dephospho-CoA kinase [Candidatus Rhabdochlamydia sp. W815]MCL6755768.1 dephospho-CoA kinase [Candidatus Rhabdochlamydia oedothoracis]QYF49453.1 Dephospho-CoA kinase [Candidatus Rhabdochlamydia oedothoracis]